MLKTNEKAAKHTPNARIPTSRLLCFMTNLPLNLIFLAANYPQKCMRLSSVIVPFLNFGKLARARQR
jgi:hypothetical protein